MAERKTSNVTSEQYLMEYLCIQSGSDTHFYSYINRTLVTVANKRIHSTFVHEWNSVFAMRIYLTCAKILRKMIVNVIFDAKITIVNSAYRVHIVELYGNDDGNNDIG